MGEISLPKVVYFLVTGLIILYASFLYTKRKDEHGNQIFLIYGFFMMYFAVVLYSSFDITAHLLKAIGFYYVFISMYKSSVELPYTRLSAMEKKLRHLAESKHKSLFDNASDAIIITDTEDNITSWNNSAELMFGWQGEKVLGENLSSLIVPDRLKPETDEIIRKVTSGEKVVGFETVRICRDGTEIDVGLTVSTIKDIQHRIVGFSVIIRDITEKIKYEKSLTKSKEFVETVLNSMNDSVSIIDVRDFKILDVNRVFLENYGLKKDEVIGKTCHKVTHHLDLPPGDNCPIVETLDSGKHSVKEHMHIVNGEPRYVEVSASPVFNEKGEILQVVHVTKDITESKLALNELKKYAVELELNKKRLEKSLQLSHMTQKTLHEISYFVLESCVNLTKSKYGFVGLIKRDESVFNILAWSKEAFTDSHVDKQLIYYPIEKAGIWSEAVRLRKSTIFNDYNAPSILKKGLPEGHVPITRFISAPIFDGDKIVALAVMANKEEDYTESDIHQLTLLMESMWTITQRKRAEEALVESEEKFRTMVEHSNDMIWTLDYEGKITYFNKIAEETTDYKLDEWVGKNFSLLINTKHLPKIKRVIKNTLNGKPKHYEVSIFNKDGKEISLSVNTAPLFDKGKVVGSVSFGRDITELKKIEELQIENIRLTLADRAKSDFLSAMSHELRTPLNASLGFSELLKQGAAGELNEKQENFVDKIIKSNSHLLELIGDILDISKIEAGKMELTLEKVSVSGIIDNSIGIINVLAAKHDVVIIKEIDPELDFIDGDYQKLKQILLNLLNNAVKFSKEDGGIITVSAKKESNMAMISVSDTGIGIKDEDISKLFKKFEQIDNGINNKYGGTGLGLVISKKLVELHAGIISVESDYGVGSTFTFSIPIHAEKDTEK